MTTDFNGFSGLVDDLSDEDAESIEFSLEKVKENLPNYSNEKLCDMVVCDRYFGFEKKISSICMQELANWRVAGDSFAFEDYINKAQKDLPVLEFKIPDIRSILSNAIKGQK